MITLPRSDFLMLITELFRIGGQMSVPRLCSLLRCLKVAHCQTSHASVLVQCLPGTAYTICTQAVSVTHNTVGCREECF